MVPAGKHALMQTSPTGRPIKLCRLATVVQTFQTLLREQLQVMAEAGFRVTLVCSPDPALQDIADGLGFDYRAIPMARKPDPFHDLVSLRRLARLFKQERFDLVHSSTPKAGLLTAMAGRLSRVPVRIHTYTGQPWVEMNGAGREIVKRCDWLIGKLNTHCYADSHSQSRFLVEEGVIADDRITVLGAGSIAGVDLERFDPARWGNDTASATRMELGVDPEAVLILFVGRVTKDKGVAELVEAFNGLISRVDRPVELLLVGPLEPDQDPLPEGILNEIEHNPHIHAVGFTREPEKYMAAADIFCLPSYREGFGSVVIEAAAMGVPAVATSVTGLVDAVVDGKTGLLVPAKNVGELGQALLRLIDQPDLRAEMGQAARNRAIKEFDARLINGLVVDEYRRWAGQSELKA
jgi:glycosyltransferase involved in cell wall biosynthesis